MPACGLRRDAGHSRQFCRGQGAAIHQSVKHAGTSGVSSESGNPGEQCSARHSIDLDPGRQRSRRMQGTLRPFP
jgi:hypothetical protein